jgi:phage baseplate assembly protein V
MNVIDATLQAIKRKIFLMIGRGIISAWDNTGNTALVQIKGLNGETITGIEFLSAYGFEARPSAGQVAVIYVNGNRDQGIVIAAHDRDSRPKIENDESQMYSKFGGYVKCNKDGNVEIQGTADFAVAYTDLKTAFDTLVADFNKHVLTYNGHTHPTAPVGPVSVTASQGTTTTADMSGAKVAEVLLP